MFAFAHIVSCRRVADVESNFKSRIFRAHCVHSPRMKRMGKKLDGAYVKDRDLIIHEIIALILL